ncbi:MAG TPA: acyl-CoA dehydrogenase family protein [Acidimicrobiales bacterium]|nr:acyl-CoA dehydrogenase family protein [Acidimicrobiales bacterium]
MEDLEAVRRDVTAWLDEHWDPERPLREWRSMLADSGWGCPTWPVEHFGRGLPRAAAAVVDEEFDRAGAVGPAGGSAMSLAAPTILEHGSDELRHRLLRGILTGEETWCQLFSEPGSGSDLAGLTTRAIRDGDEWLVNGQKVWTTGARTAAFGMLLARTDWDAPKHRGITWFALPMRQPGVEVRPLRQMNGYASFNEVFLTDARVPHANVVGDVDGGWRVGLTTLAHERGLSTLRFARAPARADGRTRREATEEATEYAKTYVWYPQRAGRADLVVPRALETGRNSDPVVRQEAAALHAVERTARGNVARAAAARAEGRPPGPEGSLAKLLGSDIARRSARLHARISGAAAMLSGPESPADGIVAEVLVSVPGASIAGGTDEIQHNIVGERTLGLPREPAVDVDVPFRDVRTNTGRG